MFRVIHAISRLPLRQIIRSIPPSPSTALIPSTLLCRVYPFHRLPPHRFFSSSFPLLSPTTDEIVSSASSLLQKGSKAQLLNLLKVGKEPTPDLANLAFRLISLVRDTDATLAEQLLRKYEAICPERPSKHLYIAVITAYCRQKTATGVTKAALIFEDLKRHNFPLSVREYTLLMHSYCRVGNIVAANDLLREMEESGVKADVVCFGALIDGCARMNMMTEAERMFRRMDELNLVPNTVVYNSLIQGWVKQGDSSRALWWYDVMKREGVAPDAYSYNHVLTALWKDAAIAKAEEIFAEMTARGGAVAPNVFTYSIMINGFCKQEQLTQAEQYFQRMISSGVFPNDVTFNSLMTGYIRADNLAMAERYFEEISRNNLSNVVSYSIIIDGYLRAGWIKKATDTFDKMVRAGIKPTASLYCIMISGFSMAKDIQSAMLWIRRMRADGFPADMSVLNSLIVCYCLLGELDRAQAIFDDVVARNIGIQSVASSMLMDMYCKSERLEDALKIWKIMKSTPDYVISTRSYGVIIHGYCLAGRLDEARLLASEVMRRTDCDRDAECFSPLIAAYARQRTEAGYAHARSLFDQMLEWGVKPAKSIFADIMSESVLRAHRMRWLELAQQLQILPTSPWTVKGNTIMIDLHGMTKPQSDCLLVQCMDYVHSCSCNPLSPHRSLDQMIVITGRGLHSEETGVSVLKQMVVNLVSQLSGFQLREDPENEGRVLVPREALQSIVRDWPKTRAEFLKH